MNRTFLFRAALLFVVAAGFAVTKAHAQAFNKNIQSLAAGYGLGTLMGPVNNALSNYGITSQSLAGPYYLKYEKGLTNHFGFGFNASVMRNQWDLRQLSMPRNGTETINFATAEVERWSYSAVARLNYHFAKKQNAKLDPYFGAGLGYRSANWSVESNSQEFNGLTRMIPNTPLAFEFTLGARYYIVPGMGVYAEFGGSKSLLQGGLIMNLPTGNKDKPVGAGKGGGKPVGGSSPTGGSGSGGGGSVGGKKK